MPIDLNKVTPDKVAMASIANYISTCRFQANMSRKDVARATGLSEMIIGNIEKGHREVTVTELRKLSEAMGARLVIQFGSNTLSLPINKAPFDI